LAILSRQAGWNTTDTSLANHFANVMKTFASIPNLIASYTGKFATAGAAADFDPVLDLNADMGIANIAWTPEMQRRLDPDIKFETVDGREVEIESETDIGQNLEWVCRDHLDAGLVNADGDSISKVVENITGGALTLNSDCDVVMSDEAFGDIEESSNNPEVNITTDNYNPKYVEHDEYYQRASIYLMDWFLMVSGECLETNNCEEGYDIKGGDYNEVDVEDGNNDSNLDATIVGDMAFPLVTTKSALEARGYTGSKPNNGHPYAAADIFASTGTSVVAMHSGKVTSLGSSSRYGKSVSVYDSEDGLLYYYTHMGNVSVKKGDTLKAGDKIGEVGTSADANGTSPHLHIDVNKSKTRPACSRSTPKKCKAIPFIKIDSYLINLYNELQE
jgi:murein DD-endopeptidase MepM/ murein hydrolase activator NlpD